MWIKFYFLKYFKTFDADKKSYLMPNLSSTCTQNKKFVNKTKINDTFFPLFSQFF